MGGGGDTNGFRGAVVKYKGSVTLEEIEIVKNWLSDCTEVTTVTIGELVVLWK